MIASVLHVAAQWLVSDVERLSAAEIGHARVLRDTSVGSSTSCP